MSEKPTPEEFAAQMRNFIEARQNYPHDELYARYAGKCIAWGPDGTTIIASADNYEELDRLVREAGYDPNRCIWDCVATDTTV